MYCPQCGQERISNATSFCSRCGYLLTGTADLLRTGGAVTVPTSDVMSPRSRGVKQGLFMFLLMFVVAPIVGLISTFGLGIEPWPVGVVVALLGVGGMLRIIYALMFEPKKTVAVNERRVAGQFNPAENFTTSALPPSGTTPTAADYMSPNTDRREQIAQNPSSVIEGTTRLLEKDTE